MTARSLILAALLTASSAHAQNTAPKAGGPDPVVKHQQSTDPAAMKGPAGVQTLKAGPAKPVAPPPPTGAEVGKAIDAMASSCSKALELHTEIAATAERRKASQATRVKSNVELKKKLRAVALAQKKVERASKKPGTDAVAMTETAKADYEAALAQSKTVEVETQNMQAAEDQLLKLVAAAEEATASCTTYEASIRAAATAARKAVVEAKRHAAKARAMAALRAAKALEFARAQQSKELVTIKTDTETARTAFEAMKTEAAKQPPPVVKATPATPATPAASKKAADATPGKSAEPHGKSADAPGKAK